MKRLLVIIATIATLFIFPMTVSAGIYQDATPGLAGCNDAGLQYVTVCFSESSSNGGDHLISTNGSDIWNLADRAHTLGGLCSPKVIGPDNWNDCISSVAMWGQIDDWLCMWTSSNGNGSSYRLQGYAGVWRYTAIPNDAISSFEVFVNYGVSPPDCIPEA